MGGGCCPGGLLPHLTVGETEAQQGKSSSPSCIESPLLATLTCSSSACPALCSQLPGRGGLLSLPCSEEETKAQQKGEGGPDLWGSQAELYTRSTAWGAGLWVPRPRAGHLLLGPAGARAAAALLDLWGQGLHGASTYGLVTSCLQGPLRVQPSCRSLAGGPRSVWDGGRVTLARWARLGRAMMGGLHGFLQRAQPSAGQQSPKQHRIPSLAGPGT